MPKQVYKIDQFHGGLNDQADPRDIEDSQLSVAVDVCVDEVGRVRPLGGTTGHSTAQSPGSATITAGYGLFTFGHDKDNGQAAGGADGSDVPCEYLLFSDGSANADIAIYNGGTDGAVSAGTGRDTWGEAKIGLGCALSDGAAGGKSVFYSADGAVRISDGQNVSGNQSPQWYGYIDQQLYHRVPSHSGLNIEAGSGYPGASNSAITGGWLDGQFDYTIASGAGDINAATIDFSGGGYSKVTGLTSTAAFALSSGSGGSVDFATVAAGGDYLTTITGWYATDAEIQAPEAGSNSASAPTASKRQWNLNISATPSNDSSTWIADTYQIALSLIYDGNQESLLHVPASTHEFTVAAGDSVQMVARMESLANSTGLSPRVTGGRAYFRVSGSDEEWRLLAEMDVYHGLRADLNTDEWAGWGEYAANDLKTCTTSLTVGNVICESITMNSDTYRSINGYGPDEISISNKSYACATVVGRTVYVGNVRRINKSGTTVIQGDAMYKSIPGKFDVFPASNKIEVNVRDGEDIVALESFADRILQFKQRTLYVINVGGAFEFLEDKHSFKGVSHPAAVCKTDFGIAWANNLGCYLYDGRSVRNLLEKNGQKVIDDGTWQSFFTANGMVGYIPKKRQIVVVKDSTATSAGDSFLYDMVTRSWVQGNSKFNDSALKTNFITDWNNDLVYGHTNGTIVKWDPDAVASGTFAFETKDIDFGHPGVRKKIHRVRVSYKGNGSTIDVQYRRNGDNNTTHPFYRTTETGATDGTNSDTTPLLDVGTDDWVLAELKPVSSSDSNNLNSLQLVFGGTSVADFEINDISIIYRMKTIK